METLNELIEDHVVLVDDEDREVGTLPKTRAHVEGALHRAVSVFVFDATGTKMLLQQRAAEKYHSGGLWSNACCSHPYPGEAAIDAANRRLADELGFACPLEFAFSFVYRAAVGPSLLEHELDHVFIGRCTATPVPNPAEVSSVRWMPVADVVADVASHPERYSVWFPFALAEMRARGIIA